jgi:hypothetical protein
MDVQGTFHNGVKQQYWKQEVINQKFDLLPKRPIQGRVPAQKVTAQNQGKIRE